MTSNITTIYNTILTQLTDLYPTKTRIPNPYSLEDNNKNFLTNGYGLTVGGANFEPFEFCNFVVARSFGVILTKEVFRRDSQTHDAPVIDLLEDVYSVQKLFYSYNELGIEANILKVDIDSTSEVSQFYGEKQNFISMTANFIFQVRENL